MRLEFTIPIKATFTLNSREHWSVRARMRSSERRAVAFAYTSATRSYRDRASLWSKSPHIPVRIALTRIGPRFLDSDNVQGALKAIRDEVAKQLGLDDGDERLTWAYSQERGKYGVRVVIEAMEAAA